VVKVELEEEDLIELGESSGWWLVAGGWWLAQ
jgi:hypothetical protein